MERERVKAFTLYDDDAKEIVYGMKDDDELFLDTAAERMSYHIPPMSILIPIPSHRGRATVSLALAQRIRDKSPEESKVAVMDILEGRRRESWYETKKRGGYIPDVDFTMRISSGEKYDRLVELLKEGYGVIFIDDVIGTGRTAEAAFRAFPDASFYAYAIDLSAFIDTAA